MSNNGLDRTAHKVRGPVSPRGGKGRRRGKQAKPTGGRVHIRKETFDYFTPILRAG